MRFFFLKYCKINFILLFSIIIFFFAITIISRSIITLYLPTLSFNKLTNLSFIELPNKNFIYKDVDDLLIIHRDLEREKKEMEEQQRSGGNNLAAPPKNLAPE